MQQKLADKLYDFKQMELDKRAKELQKAEEECRRAINTAVKDYNAALVIFYSVYQYNNILDSLS